MTNSCVKSRWLISVYDFTMSRARDGYDGIFLNSDGKILKVACWAHARRWFYDARSNAPRERNRFWSQSGNPMTWRTGHETSRPRSGWRCGHGSRCQSSIESRLYLDELSPRVLAKSALVRSLTYARNQRAALRRNVSGGRLALDNNFSERTVRLQAISSGVLEDAAKTLELRLKARRSRWKHNIRAQQPGFSLRQA